MDLVRDLLLRIAADPKLNGTNFCAFDKSDQLGDYSQDEINYHVDLLFAAGLVEGSRASEEPLVSRLTWKGHEFVDNIRDAGIWGEVKKRIKGLPSVAVGVVIEIASAEIKKRLGL